MVQHTHLRGGGDRQPAMHCQGAGTIPLGGGGEGGGVDTSRTSGSVGWLTANSTGSCSKFLMFSGNRNSALRCLVGSTLCKLACAVGRGGGVCKGFDVMCVCVCVCTCSFLCSSLSTVDWLTAMVTSWEDATLSEFWKQEGGRGGGEEGGRGGGREGGREGGGRGGEGEVEINVRTYAHTCDPLAVTGDCRY